MQFKRICQIYILGAFLMQPLPVNDHLDLKLWVVTYQRYDCKTINYNSTCACWLLNDYSQQSIYHVVSNTSS